MQRFSGNINKFGTLPCFVVFRHPLILPIVLRISLMAPRQSYDWPCIRVATLKWLPRSYESKREPWNNYSKTKHSKGNFWLWAGFHGKAIILKSYSIMKLKGPLVIVFRHEVDWVKLFISMYCINGVYLKEYGYGSRFVVVCSLAVPLYSDVIMSTVAFQTSLTIVYSTVYSGADQGEHQSSASLAFVWGIPRTNGQ